MVSTFNLEHSNIIMWGGCLILISKVATVVFEIKVKVGY